MTPRVPLVIRVRRLPLSDIAKLIDAACEILRAANDEHCRLLNERDTNGT